MPLDTRRFNGPEDAVPYQFYTKNYIRKHEEISKELLNNENKRKDGRALGEAGSMYININVVTEAKGSAYIELRDTKVICSVFDPREIPHQNEFSQQGELNCEVRYAPFSCPGQRRQLAPEEDEKALSAALREALEPAVCRYKFANYQVDIFVYIIENDGSCLAAAINAAGIALANAAVPMYDLIAASSVAVSGKRYFTDPTEAEEFVALDGSSDSNHGVVTLALLPDINQVTHFNVIGSMDNTIVSDVMDILILECKNMLPAINKCILKFVQDSFEIKKEAELLNKDRNEELNRKLEEWKQKLK